MSFLKHIVLPVLALMLSLPAMAVRAYPYPVIVRQPDGTTLQIIIHGDENWSYKTTLDGRIVVQGKDGYYRFTDSIPSQPQMRKAMAPEGMLEIGGATRATVSVKTIVIPVQFPDRKFTVPQIRAAVYNLFNQLNYSDNGATGSVRDYFRDNLSGYCNFSFDVCDPVTVSSSYAYYGANEDGVTDVNVRELVLDACDAASGAGVDFSRYDSDGDGIVDNVFLFFAGHNEAEGGGDDAIWPQSWNVSDKRVYYNGKKLSNFSLYSEYSGAYGSTFAGIGTICHEYCHMLGLLDMYDVNGEKEGLSNGLGGPLSIMDLGNYNNGGKTPPYLNIIERQALGLVSFVNASEGDELSIEPVQNAKEVYRMVCSPTPESYWLEYRDGSKWDQYIGGSGLVIYHVDKSINTAGSMSAMARWSKNAVNACGNHPCADPVAYDGGQVKDPSDVFFPGIHNVETILSSVNFALFAWSGDGLGLGLRDIVRGATSITCKVVPDDGWVLPVVTSYSVSPSQTSAVLSWEADKRVSGVWNIVWGDRSSAETSRATVRNATEYTFEGLEPGKEYVASVFFSRGDEKGKAVSVEFRTVKRLSEFPLIGGMDMPLKKGTRLKLEVLNITEEVSSVRWTVNGKAVDDGFFLITETGRYQFEARIAYPDGSVEVLTKSLNVNE